MTDLLPEANRPGHHPDHEQDKPDLAAFREKAAQPHGEPLPPEAAATPVFPEERGIFGVLGMASLGLGSKAVRAIADRL